MLGTAIYVGAQVQHGRSTALGIGYLCRNRGAVDSVQGFEEIASDGHQSARVARRNGGLCGPILDLLNCNAHGRILFTAQGNLHWVVHGDDLAGRRDSGPIVLEVLEAFGLADKEQTGFGMVF